MNSRKSAKLKRKLIISAAALFCTVTFAVTFAKGAFVPGWDEIFGFFGLKTPVSTGSTEDFVKISDVGQGDSILIHSNGYSALIDSGTPESAAEIFNDLDSAGVKNIDVLLISHFHDDHYGAAEAISGKYKIDNLITPKAASETDIPYSLGEVKRKVVSDGGNVYEATQGMHFNVGEFEITVLANFSTLAKENDRSVIAMAEIHGQKFLFTGDAEKAAEKALLKEGLDLDCDVLKVGHHGSNSSSTSAFLKEATPDYAGISVGKNNIYSHPSKVTLDFLSDCGIKTFRTDTDGDISFYIENGKIRTETQNK